MAGELYEMKLAALLFIRCLIAGHPFKIASNMKAAGQFDDIVLGLLGELPVLVQQKHSSNRRKAVYDYKFTRLKGDFALLKYCETYSSLTKQWGHDLARCGIFEKCIFVLYTNAKVACLRKPIDKQKNNMSNKLHMNSKAADAWQNLLNTGGNFCPILRETHPKIYEVFDNVPEYKRILKDRSKSDELLRAVKALWNKDAKKVPSKEDLDKLAAQLEKLKGVDCYEEFLPRVWVFGSQASEQKLNSLIEIDVRKLMGVICSKSITDALLQSIQRWWQYDKQFLNEGSRLWQDILESRWELLSSVLMSRLCKLMIEFDQQEIKRMKEVLSKNTHMTHIVTRDSPILTCLKVVGCLKESKCIVVDRETFERNQREIMSYSKHNIILILFCEYDDCDAVRPPINDIEMKEGKWRIILISRFKHRFETLEDLCNLSQLHENSRETLLGKYVSFQGKEIPLNSITGEDDKVLSKISGDIIVQLLDETKRMSIGSPPSEVIHYYINRTIQRNDNINKKILQEDAVFAITGPHALDQLVPEGEKVMKYLRGKEVEKSCRFYQIKNGADFEELCTTFQSIYWLHDNGETFQWMQSKGPIQIVRKYLAETEAASCCNEMSLCERFVILIADPGMGKSTLLSYIAQEIKKLRCSSWVIKINLNDYGEYLCGNDLCPDTFLESALNITDDFQRSLLQLSLDVVGNIIILLDGFDEISPYYADQVITIVQKFLRDTRVEQIWLTSRPIMKNKLEETFCTLSYVLKPFSETDKKTFLCKFWNVRDIERFAIDLLNVTGWWLNDKLGEFTGIPLQIMMLAEAFREEMLHYKNTGKNSLPKRLDILQLYEKFIDTKLKIYFGEKLKLNVYNAGIRAKLETERQDFYEKHMKCAILSIFSQEHLSKLPFSDKLKQSIEDFVMNIKQGKEKTGIIMSVRNDKPTFIHRTFAEYFAAMWLVQNYNKNKDLVQYLLFSPAFETMQIFFNRCITRDCILHVAVLNEDKRLVKQLVGCEPAVLNSVDKCGRTALHLAVMNYTYPSNDKNVNHSRIEILETILSSKKDILTVSDQLLCWTPLKYADKIHAWEVIDLLLQKGADEGNMEFTYAALNDTMYLREILKLNIIMGHKNVIEYLIRCKPAVVNEKVSICYNHWAKSNRVWITPLHEACLIGEREITELLIENGANLEAQDNVFGDTPLLWAAKRSQWDIVVLLISKGADITAISSMTYANAIHVAAKSHSDDLLSFLFEEKLFPYVNAHTLQLNTVWESAKLGRWAELLLSPYKVLLCYMAPKGSTLLHFAVESADNDIMCLLLQYPAVLNQLNTSNTKGELPLECAALAKRWDLVENLLRRGADCTSAFANHVVALGSVDLIEDLLKIPGVPDFLISNSPTERSLLVLAADSKQWDTFRFLIKHGLTLPAHAGTTLLHLAVKSNNPSLLDFVLDYTGLAVDVINAKQETAFMCAAREANEYVLERLLERGADPLLVHSTGGYTALHLAAEYNVLSVVSFLLENTKLLDDINRINSEGSTPLMRAFRRDDGIDVSLCLLQLVAECSHRYANGNTLMHEAARIGKVEIGKLLVDRGLNPLERGEGGRSPLHVAVSEDKLEFVEWLLYKGANAYEMHDVEQSPIMYIIGRVMEKTMGIEWCF